MAKEIIETEFEIIGGPFDGSGYLLDIEERPKFSIAIPNRIYNNKDFNTEMTYYERFSHESRKYIYVGSQLTNEPEESL